MDSESATGDASPTLQRRLEVADDDRCDVVAPLIDDPVGLLQHLDVSGHFHRDSRVGRVFHRGMVSLREIRRTDSLHVSVDGNRLLAHVDGASPLGGEPTARPRTPSGARSPITSSGWRRISSGCCEAAKATTAPS